MIFKLLVLTCSAFGFRLDMTVGALIDMICPESSEGNGLGLDLWDASCFSAPVPDRHFSLIRLYCDLKTKMTAHCPARGHSVETQQKC